MSDLKLLAVDNNRALWVDTYVCRAFEFDGVVGAKVCAQPAAVIESLMEAIGRCAFPASGQAVVPLKDIAQHMSPGRVGIGGSGSAGLAREDLCVAKHRGQFGLYLRRNRLPLWASPSAPFAAYKAVIYKGHAYDIDPDCREKIPVYWLIGMPINHYVLVSMLTHYPTVEETPPYGARVLVHNIAGGNNDFIPRTTLPLPGDLFEDPDRFGPAPPGQATAGLNGGAQLQVADAKHDLEMLHRWVKLAKACEESKDFWFVADP